MSLLPTHRQRQPLQRSRSLSVILYSRFLRFICITPVAATVFLLSILSSANAVSVTFDECKLGEKLYIDHYWDQCLAVRAKGIRLEYPDRVVKDANSVSNQVLDSSGEFRVDFIDYNGTPTGLPYDVTRFSVTLYNVPANGYVRYYTRDKNFRISSPQFISGPGNKIITLSGEFREVFVENTFIGDPWTGIVDNISFDRKGTIPDPPARIFDVSFSLFIPANNLTGGPSQTCLYSGEIIPRQLYFKGDDRTFGASTKRYRGRYVFKASPDDQTLAGGVVVGSLRRLVGQTREYASDAIRNNGRLGPEDDDRVLRDCRLLTNFRTARNTEMRLSSSRINSKEISMRIYGYLGNPLITPEVPADWDITLTLNTSGTQPRWTLTGSHDGFPAYELYIDGRLIYKSDPGPAPYSFTRQIRKLFAPMDVAISTRSGVLPANR